MDPYVGEVRLFATWRVPQGWMACEGQQLPVNQYSALFAVLGYRFGGNNQTLFALPNLQGAAAIGAGSGPGLTPRTLGDTGGAATVALSSTQIPGHTHQANSTASSTPSATATNTVWANGIAPMGARQPGQKLFVPAPDSNTFMNPAAVLSTGNNVAHDNLQPALVIRYCIAVWGIFPVNPQ